MQVITFSWDDGHPLDLQVADLLSKYGFKATFYVPNSNREGFPVLNDAQLRCISSSFEIGSHTDTHCYLNSGGSLLAKNEVVNGKDKLENRLGHATQGFCYPGGKYNKLHIELLKSVGVSYARTVKNFCSDMKFNAYEMPTTVQFYPHSKTTYLKNYIKGIDFKNRINAFSSLIGAASLNEKIFSFAKLSKPSVLHIWGHSWELERFGGLKILEELLIQLSDVYTPQQRITNHELYLLSR